MQKKEWALLWVITFSLAVLITVAFRSSEGGLPRKAKEKREVLEIGSVDIILKNKEGEKVLVLPKGTKGRDLKKYIDLEEGRKLGKKRLAHGSKVEV